MDMEAFKTSLKFQCTATSETVLANLEALRQLDQATELELANRPEYRGCYLLGFGPPVAMLLFLVTTIQFNIGANPWFGVVLLISAAVATTLSIVGLSRVVNTVKLLIEFNRKAAELFKIDLDNRRYELVAGLVRLLSADISSDALLTVAIDFRDHDHRDKRLPTRYVGDWNNSSYIDHWLQLRGRLLDGTKFTIRLIEKQQLRRRQKISASGKQKTKTKTKISSEAILTLNVKPKRYPRVTQQHDVMDQYVKLPKWAVL